MESTNTTNSDPFKSLSVLCKEPFWNISQVWALPEPNLGPCVERTVLVWAPCLLLWACGLPSLLRLKRRPYNPIPWTPLSYTKLMVSVLMLAVAATELAWAATAGAQVVPPADFIAPAVLLATQVLHISLVLLGRRKGEQNSGIIWLFWLFMILCGLPQLYTSITAILRKEYSLPAFLTATFILHFLCSVALFLANCFSDALSLTQRLSATKKPTPRLQASILSRLFFFWSYSLIWRGWRRPLTPEDLWDVEPDNSTSAVAAQWDAAINRDGKATPTESKEPGRLQPVVVAVSGRQASVLRCLWRMVRAPFLGGGVLYFLSEASRFLTPQVLSLIITFMTTPRQPAWYGYLFAVVLFSSCALNTLLKNRCFYRMLILSIRVRSAIMTAVYRKALSLSGAARRDSTIGEIVNLMAVDAQCVGDTLIQLWSIVFAPVVILVSMVFLWQELGVSVLSGVAMLVLIIPLNSYLTSRMKSLLFSTLQFRDQRVKMVSEIINGIKVLKLYAWEGSFAAKVDEIRSDEIRRLKKVAILKAFNSFVFNASPCLVALVTFTTYLLISPENVLDAKKAFVSISLFNIMRMPMIQLPSIISQLIQAIVALQRVQKFISAEELDPTAVCKDRAEANALVIRNGKFSWEADEGQLVWQLENINLEVGHGTLVAVVGSVGAGKSSLISALLGEMKKEAGRIVVNGRVAYVSQQAWLQNATLRDNITWGEHFDAKRYHKVVKACALQPDLDMLPGGDMTEIGEKGINLSGGQKQRVSLARAAYSDADIVLFDDPLSAVDAHVGRYIFDNVIGPQGILRDKTRLLVTHAVTFLPRVDEVVVMEGGRVVEKGSYADLVAKQGDFANYVLQHINDTTDKDAEEEFEELYEQLEQVAGAEPLLRQLSMRSSKTSVNNIGSDTDVRPRGKRIRSVSETVTSSRDLNPERQATKLSSSSLNRKAGRHTGNHHDHGRRRNLTDAVLDRNYRSHSYANGLQGSKTSLQSGRSEVDMTMEDLLSDVSREEGEVEGKKLVEVETSETGKVSRKMYLIYGKSIGLCLAMIPIIFISLGQASIAGSNVWLSIWSSAGESAPALNSTRVTLNTSAHSNASDYSTSYTVEEPASTGVAVTRDIFLVGYAAFGIGQAIFLFLGMLTMMLGCLRSSRVLHQRLLDSVVRLPMSFFDTNPSGRIINRFSKEVNVLDNTLPDIIRSFLSCAAQVISTMIVIIAATPIAGLFIVPIMAVYYLIQVIYIASSRQLKRIESVAKSPIYSHFSETLQGVSTIRAYKREQEFYEESQSKIENSLKAVYVNIFTNRWVAVCLEMLGNLITFAAAIMGVAGRGSINSGVVGLSISYALNVTSVLNWVVRIAADLEANIVSVERISEYMKKEREASWTSPDTRSSWPEDGHVSFRNYQTRYRPGLELVLKGITCSFKPGEKVGIVGRTGAGKSSLTLALFRIIEAAGGEIDIDKVSIADVGLHDLRGRVSIIPQDPVLFSGTLRLNLDPLGTCSDDDIWRALELAHLADYIRAQPSGLQHTVDEEGSNFSVGQRQLVCLARALLRNSRILVLDEATAAIDLETDDLIQATIRSQFEHCTVLTIAHRLNTIMDSDRVLVLDQGKIAEFAPPAALLADRDSIFYGMARDAGLV